MRRLDPGAWSRLPARLGWPGVAGLLMLGWAAWLSWHALPALQDEQEALQQQMRQARRAALTAPRLAAAGAAPGRDAGPHAVAANGSRAGSHARSAGGPPPAPPTSASALLAQLQAGLPRREQRADVLAALLAQAQAAGLQVDAVSYRSGPTGWPGVSRDEVALPVRGDYAAVRGWLADALARQPALSLDAISLRRPDPQAQAVDARLSWSLWTRGGPLEAQP